jgi:phosphatidylglycerophosphate synthase
VVCWGIGIPVSRPWQSEHRAVIVMPKLWWRTHEGNDVRSVYHLLRCVSGSRQMHSEREAMWTATRKTIGQVLNIELWELMFALYWVLSCFFLLLLLWIGMFTLCLSHHCIFEVCNFLFDFYRGSQTILPCISEETGLLSNDKGVKTLGTLGDWLNAFFIMRLILTFVSGTYYYGLNLGCLPKVHVVKDWCPMWWLGEVVELLSSGAYWSLGACPQRGL